MHASPASHQVLQTGSSEGGLGWNNMRSIFSVHGCFSAVHTAFFACFVLFECFSACSALLLCLTATNVMSKSQAKTRKDKEICERNKTAKVLSSSLNRLCRKKLWLGILSPQNPSSDNNDLSSRCAAVMCFVLQVLILQAFHALHPDLFQTHSREHYDSV